MFRVQTSRLRIGPLGPFACPCRPTPPVVYLCTLLRDSGRRRPEPERALLPLGGGLSSPGALSWSLQGECRGVVTPCPQGVLPPAPRSRPRYWQARVSSARERRPDPHRSIIAFCNWPRGEVRGLDCYISSISIIFHRLGICIFFWF